MSTTTRYESVQEQLRREPARWLVTGCAGFIGSHITEELLRLGQSVRGLDNFATGSRKNLEDVRGAVPEEAWKRFELVEGDVSNPESCALACQNVAYVLHQAALGSVPRSIQDPLATNRANVEGFLAMLAAAKAQRIRRFVYASSSSVYGDSPHLPKTEDRVGRPLSPYAVTKYVDELYAAVYRSLHGFETVGLRYFNVFGPRQDPNGPYAAVVPRWLDSLAQGTACSIHGDGETSRDFCYVANVVQANLLAATQELDAGSPAVFNIACGAQTTLNEMFRAIQAGLHSRLSIPEIQPSYGPFREGDVRHSLARIDRARQILGYEPRYTAAAGVTMLLDWYVRNRQAGARR
jgi:UDP-N-acetylglucosamine/UDP-N-acetylgalactosamine 4-epimerase